MIWVVDSSDSERIDGDVNEDLDYDNAKEELHSLLREDSLRDIPVLVYANKQDLPKAVQPRQLAKRLDLIGVKDREWHIQPCVATKGDGLYEGLDWLSNALKRSKKSKR